MVLRKWLYFRAKSYQMTVYNEFTFFFKVKKRKAKHTLKYTTQQQQQKGNDGEDLTYANYQVSKKAMEHSATLAVWSSNGKILAKVKNGRIVRLNIHTDLDEVFKRAMYSNAMSADEDN